MAALGVQASRCACYWKGYRPAGMHKVHVHAGHAKEPSCHQKLVILTRGCRHEHSFFEELFLDTVQWMDKS
eukprot:282127-Pelagomonas_calceolata.AAC.1